MRWFAALLLAALTMQGCGMSTEEELATTEAELAEIIEEAVAATDLPVTRRWEPPGLFLGCSEDTDRLAQKVNADDPPQLQPYYDGLVEHLQAQGFELADELEFTNEEGMVSTSTFLLRDGFEAIVDLVRGKDGTGIDLEVLSPCRELRG